MYVVRILLDICNEEYCWIYVVRYFIFVTLFCETQVVHQFNTPSTSS